MPSASPRPRRTMPDIGAASSSSLSSVVSNLVRAQMGTSLTSTVTDADLDRHVAELILKEAKRKAERYKEHGVHAFVTNRDSDAPAPRTNKRFLTSIIKSTDEHNKTVLKAQAQAAQDLKLQRAAQEKEERRKRAEEAVEAERLRRRLKSGNRDTHDRDRESSRRRRDDDVYSRSKGKGKERERDWERDDRETLKERGKSRRGEDRDKRSPSRCKDTKSRSGSSRTRKSESWWDRWDGTEARKAGEKRIKFRDWATWTGQDGVSEGGDLEEPPHTSRASDASPASASRSRRRDRSRSPSTRTDNDAPRRERPRSHSPSTSSRTARSVSPKRRPRHALDALSDEEESSNRRSPSPSSPRKRARSPSPSSKRSKPKISSSSSSKKHHHKRRPRHASPSPSRSITPGPTPAPPSKMDKYFEESYDPRLDVAPLTAPVVPATGLINDYEYDGWDAMLALVRQRQQDREDKKVLERMGISKDSSTAKKKSASTVGAAGTLSETSIMDIEYTKRGAVREWDLGKEVTY